MTEADEDVLKAEVVALQAVLMSVFRRLATDRPEFAPLFCQAFDEAETIVAGVAVKIGLEAPLGSTVGALKVIDEMRAAVIRDPSACRDGEASRLQDRLSQTRTPP
jgi:hypothetical protein